MSEKAIMNYLDKQWHINKDEWFTCKDIYNGTGINKKDIRNYVKRLKERELIKYKVDITPTCKGEGKLKVYSYKWM